MTKKIGKVRKQVRATNREQKQVQSESHDVPRTMVFCKSGASAPVRQLVEDFKSVMEPYTTTNLKCSKRNKMKNLIDNATTLNVNYIIYFTEKTASKASNWDESTNYEIGGVYCHVICVPHGPTFTYKLTEYSLKKDIQNANGFCMNSNWLQQPPLIILNGFGNAANEQHLKAVSSSFQNMLPSININKTRIRTMRRAVLLSRYGEMPHADEKTQKDWGEVFVFRHYNIKLENKELNKGVRKLGIGAASRNSKIPDLSKYRSIEDFMMQTGNISESDMSDADEPATVDLIESVKELPGCSGKTAIKMMEVGPRITMQLLKIEAGVHSGAVIYHRYVKKSAEEVFANEKRREEKLKLKQARRKQQEKNVEEKNKLKSKKKKQQPQDPGSEESAEEGDEETKEKTTDADSVDDAEEEEVDDEEEEEVENVDDEKEENEESEEEIEEVNDSLDECSANGDEELSADESSEGLDDSDDGLEELGEGFEDVDDSMDEENDDSVEDEDNVDGSSDIGEGEDNDEDEISDVDEDEENSDFEVKENIKSKAQIPLVGQKRPMKTVQKSHKKRKM